MKTVSEKKPYKVKQLPKEAGILFFPISMSNISNIQSGKACLSYILNLYEKVPSSSEGVSINILYSDYLYLLNSIDSPVKLRKRFLDLMNQHKQQLINLIKKTSIPVSQVKFFTWGELMLEHYSIIQHYKKELKDKSIINQAEWERAVQLDSSERILTPEQREFIEEEAVVLHLIQQQKVSLKGSHFTETPSWVLQCYPGEPLKTETLLSELNPFKLSSSNLYANSSYNLKLDKLIKVVSPYEKVAIRRFNYDNDFYVTERDPYGLSLFTRRDFKTGELLFTVKGLLTKTTSRYTIPVDTTWKIEPRLPKPELATWLSHSCDPNAGLRVLDSPQIIARRNIKKNEEVTIDYGTLGWDFGNEWLLKDRACHCQTAKCRHIVTGWKDIPQETKKTYIKEGIVLDFLIDK